MQRATLHGREQRSRPMCRDTAEFLRDRSKEREAGCRMRRTWWWRSAGIREPLGFVAQLHGTTGMRCQFVMRCGLTFTSRFCSVCSAFRRERRDFRNSNVLCLQGLQNLFERPSALIRQGPLRSADRTPAMVEYHPPGNSASSSCELCL
jgi:hypothetical protein